MSPADTLPTIAEMAITIAGFTGLIISIRPREANSWGSDEVGRVIGIVAACLVTALCSILPFAISGLNVQPHLVWAIPLMISGVVSTMHLAIILWQNFIGKFFFIMRAVSYPLFLVLGISSLISLLSGLGILFPYSPGILVFQLIWVLFVSAFSLAASVAVIFKRHKN